MNYSQALKKVPDYKRFLTLDEMLAHAREVVEKNPTLARYQEVGHSTDGEPIPMISIGNGPTPVLLFACPHPNEPIGAMLIQFLLDELIESEELRSPYTWHLIPCVDPDGTRLNEGWFAGPFSIRNYARDFYRPRSEEQVEWTFPMSYKKFVFDKPMPETKALMNAFDSTQPEFVYSLHNAGFGGVYYYISHDLKAAYEAFNEIPESLGLYMQLGEPEAPWAKTFAPAIYERLGVASAYDYFEQYGAENPAELIHGGGSSADYLDKLGNPVMLITELPYFQSPQVADTSPLEQTRGQVILQGIEKDREILESLLALVEATEPQMTLDTRFWRASSTFIKQLPKSLESKIKWAQEFPGMHETATVAQQSDALYVASFYKVLIAGMLDRAYQAQLEVDDSPTIREAQTKLKNDIERWIVDIESHLDYTPIPIQKLVQAQYGAMLAVLDAMREGPLEPASVDKP